MSNHCSFLHVCKFSVNISLKNDCSLLTFRKLKEIDLIIIWKNESKRKKMLIDASIFITLSAYTTWSSHCLLSRKQLLIFFYQRIDTNHWKIEIITQTTLSVKKNIFSIYFSISWSIDMNVIHTLWFKWKQTVI